MQSLSFYGGSGCQAGGLAREASGQMGQELPTASGPGHPAPSRALIPHLNFLKVRSSSRGGEQGPQRVGWLCFWAKPGERSPDSPLNSPTQLVSTNIYVQTHRPGLGAQTEGDKQRVLESISSLQVPTLTCQRKRRSSSPRWEG